MNLHITESKNTNLTESIKKPNWIKFHLIFSTPKTKKSFFDVFKKEKFDIYKEASGFMKKHKETFEYLSKK